MGIQYDYKVDSVFDPFDKEQEYSQKTQESKELTKTSLLLRPQYGTVFTKVHMATELGNFVTYINQTLAVNTANENNTTETFPEYIPTINDKHILLQFNSTEETTKAKSKLDLYRGKFPKGSYTDIIL